MKSPLLSVIVPVYNVENYLQKCIDSIINQTLKEIEIIIVNDGSTDSSLNILKEYAKADTRIRIITQENGGLSAARNTGLEIASAEYVSFIDSDDYIEYTMLEEMYEKAVKESSDIVMCNFDLVNEDGTVTGRSNIEEMIDTEAITKRILAGRYYSVACTNLYKKSLFIDNDITYPVGLYHEDIPTTYKLFYFAKNVSVVGKIMYHWLQRDNSISKHLAQKHIDDTFQIFQLTKEFLIDNNIFEEYYMFYIRRVFHFTMGLFSKINHYQDCIIEKYTMAVYLLNKMNKNHYETEQTLKILNEIDPKLYNAYMEVLESGLCFSYKQKLLQEQKKLENEQKYHEWSQRKLLEGQKYRDWAQNKLKSTQKQLDYINNSRLYKLLLLLRRIKNTVLLKNTPTKGESHQATKNSVIENVTTKHTVIASETKSEIENKNDKLTSTTTEERSETPTKVTIDALISMDEMLQLQSFKNKYTNKRCFIIGNGPSLNKLDLAKLQNEYTFAVNGIFYKTDEMGFKPTFYMVEDNHVVDDNLERINNYNPPYKFFPNTYADRIVKTDNTYFFNADLGFYKNSHPYYCIPRFTKDFSQISYAGQSVTYMNMQLAFYMGFTEVYLIGMDFSYQIRESDEVEGTTLLSNEDDVNHFHPEYFGKGKKWHDPKVERVGWNYEHAKNVFEKDGRKIYNATAGGKLEIFDRVDYDSLFESK